MSLDEQKRFIEIAGEDTALELCSFLANKRLPGKKFCNRILKDRFKKEFKGKDMAGFAKKYGVCLQTLYNWI
jgi:Mor family transcriptional regulator